MSNVVDLKTKKESELDFVLEVLTEVSGRYMTSVAETYNQFCEGFFLLPIPLPLPESFDPDDNLWSVAVGMTLQALHHDNPEQLQAAVELFSPDGDMCPFIQLLVGEIKPNPQLH